MRVLLMTAMMTFRLIIRASGEMQPLPPRKSGLVILAILGFERQFSIGPMADVSESIAANTEIFQDFSMSTTFWASELAIGCGAASLFVRTATGKPISR